MLEAHYFYQLSHGADSALAVRLNGIPLYRVVGGRSPVSHVAPATHLLEPGDNVLDLDLMMPNLVGGFLFALVHKGTRTTISETAWPTMWFGQPAEKRVLPYRHAHRFRMPDSHTFRPAYLDAAPTEFGPEGTPEQRVAVAAVIDAFRRSDAAAAAARLGGRTREYVRAYPEQDQVTEEKDRDYFTELLRDGCSVAPSPGDDLSFASAAGGRVAHVTRRDGRPVLAVDTPNGRKLRSDLYLTRHGDARDWWVFR